MEAIEEQSKSQAALLASRSEALCQRLLTTLSDRVAEYFRQPHSSHADGLPALLDEVLASFDAQASGPARDAFLRQLLHKLVDSVRGALQGVERAALDVKQAARARDADRACSAIRTCRA
eukprot:6188848-Prymnesium_polylepis.2